MIIHRLKLHNFGIYADTVYFNLEPQSQNQYTRPIILFRGQNGVGKSTIVEAIRLCLHGKLALGPRVTQREYDSYLERRQHRFSDGETAVLTSIEMEFDHVILGRQHRYRIVRSWRKQTSRLSTELLIWVNDEPSLETEDEKEFLLRELIPPGVAELFFLMAKRLLRFLKLVMRVTVC